MARKPHAAVQLFADLVTRDDAEIDLPAAALAIARVEYEKLDPAVHLKTLRGLCEETASDLERTGTRGRPEALSSYFSGRLGFHGNREHADDPRNSCLNQVLARRTGLPILLSIVYMQLAAACGIVCEGIGFPGHFLVRCLADGRIVDPFTKGRQLSEQDCRRLLERQGLPAARWRDEFLAPARKAEILQRMLNNLHRYYVGVGDARRVGIVVAMVRVVRQVGEIGGGLIH